MAGGAARFFLTEHEPAARTAARRYFSGKLSGKSSSRSIRVTILVSGSRSILSRTLMLSVGILRCRQNLAR